METLKIATAQFEIRSGNKKYNLGIINKLAASAASQGANVIAFHECSMTGLTHAIHLTKEELESIAEYVPGGPSVTELAAIASKHKIAILAGLFEKDSEGRLFKTHVCVNENGFVSSFRKLHPFINPHLVPGDGFCVFDLYGWKCGILICYDNNILENVRATHLLGAEILFMPHVTMCTPSTRPGAGFVRRELWENRSTDPTALRIEFDGLKGREWLMKWLPARAYDNAMYVVFSNAIGDEGGQIKNGCSMILDPFGDIIAECRRLGDDMETATCTREKLELAGGHRYKNARRPDLYAGIIGSPHTSVQHVSWKKV